MDLLLGIDVGTTNIKAVVYDPDRGEVLATASQPTPTDHPRPGWTEHDPEALWRTVCAVVRQASAGWADRIGALAVASLAEAGVPLDAHDRPVYPIIAWHDPRTEPLVAVVEQQIDPARLYAITGHPVQAKFSLLKLLWLRQHQPAAFQRLARWLCLEDYVIWRLSGEAATDYSIASRTLLFDQRQRTWSRELLDLFGLPQTLLPPAYPGGTPVGRVTPQAAATTGLRAGTLVATGGHDHLCGALAAGVTEPGQLLDSIGTAIGLVLATPTFAPDEGLRQSGYCLYCHAIPDRYVVQGGLTLGGGLLPWFLERWWPAAGGPGEAVFATALAAASAVPPGSGGLVWLPFLRGSGTPRNDARARGALVGLTADHEPRHALRALLEGLGYWLRENCERLAEREPLSEPLVAIGGGARVPLLLQLKATITGRALRAPAVAEATALGAALLAGLAGRRFTTPGEAAASVRCSDQLYTPGPDRPVYDRLYREVYRPLVTALTPLSHRLGQLAGV